MTSDPRSPVAIGQFRSQSDAEDAASQLRAAGVVAWVSHSYSATAFGPFRFMRPFSVFVDHADVVHAADALGVSRDDDTAPLHVRLVAGLAVLTIVIAILVILWQVVVHS